MTNKIYVHALEAALLIRKANASLAYYFERNRPVTPTSSGKAVGIAQNPPCGGGERFPLVG